MTAVACTGAGKSALALAIAHNEMAMGRCSLIVIVVPTRQLKRQWARTAYRAGVTLTSCWVNGVSVVPEGVHGVIVTYSQLARLPEAVRLLCGRYRVLGIMDEVHHGGDGLSWGDGLREGLEAAVARLCLSGTPFRTDQLRLPFVRYDDRGRAVGDVRYPIAQALADGVVRPVFFHAFGGKFHWRDGGGLHQATFSDQMGGDRAGATVAGGIRPGRGLATARLAAGRYGPERDAEYAPPSQGIRRLHGRLPRPGGRRAAHRDHW